MNSAIERLVLKVISVVRPIISLIYGSKDLSKNRQDLYKICHRTHAGVVGRDLLFDNAIIEVGCRGFLLSFVDVISTRQAYEDIRVENDR